MTNEEAMQDDMPKMDETEDVEETNDSPIDDVSSLNDILRTDIYSTGIKSFDSMFALKGISSGDVIEICGKATVGKSFLIHTILANVLNEHESIEALYFDTKANFQIGKFMDLLVAQGNKQPDEIANRIIFVQISNIFDLLHTLQQLIDPEMRCQKKDFDLSKIRFIVINTITLLFYQISSPLNVSKRITCDLHEIILQLSKKYGITFLIANLAVNKHKIPELDRNDEDSSAEGSVKSSQEVNSEDVKAALHEYWLEVLDYRFLMTANTKNVPDISNHVEISRQLTLVGREQSVTVKITDLGIV